MNWKSAFVSYMVRFTILSNIIFFGSICGYSVLRGDTSKFLSKIYLVIFNTSLGVSSLVVSRSIRKAIKERELQVTKATKELIELSDRYDRDEDFSNSHITPRKNKDVLDVYKVEELMRASSKLIDSAKDNSTRANERKKRELDKSNTKRNISISDDFKDSFYSWVPEVSKVISNNSLKVEIFSDIVFNDYSSGDGVYVNVYENGTKVFLVIYDTVGHDIEASLYSVIIGVFLTEYWKNSYGKKSLKDVAGMLYDKISLINGGSCEITMMEIDTEERVVETMILGKQISYKIPKGSTCTEMSYPLNSNMNPRGGISKYKYLSKKEDIEECTYIHMTDGYTDEVVDKDRKSKEILTESIDKAFAFKHDRKLREAIAVFKKDFDSQVKEPYRDDRALIAIRISEEETDGV